MKLVEGTTAPSFEVEDSKGKTWVVPGDLGDRYLALIFLRHLGCPLCMRRIDELNADAARFDTLGADVMAVVDGTPTRVRTFAEKKKITISLVGDREKNLYRGYGVDRGGLRSFLAPNVLKASVRATMKGYLHGKFEGDELQKPADFIIAPDGKLVWAHYGEDISDSSDNEILIRQLERVKT